jgi:hypothetical protein
MVEVPEERRVAGATKGLLLPGVAGIAMFLLLLTMLNTFAALRGVYGTGSRRYWVLAICTLLAVGVFGLLGMRRWGWAITTAGTLLLSAGYLYVFARMHVTPALVQGLLGMVFFLYLVRTEVRERLR